MAARSYKMKGFTLVEILVVMVIMGILAIIVIPTMTNASQSANGSSVLSQLQTVRSQLQLYQVQHNGQYPTFAQMWTNLTDPTNPDGSTGGAAQCGPYLQQPAINPYVGISTVVDATTTSTASATTGWLYNSTTGEIYASVPSAQAAAIGLTTNDVVTF